jgi:hypothetical protein
MGLDETVYYSDDQIKKGEMDGAYGAYGACGGEKMCTRGFGRETWAKQTNGKTQAYMRE